MELSCHYFQLQMQPSLRIVDILRLLLLSAFQLKWCQIFACQNMDSQLFLYRYIFYKKR